LRGGRKEKGDIKSRERKKTSSLLIWGAEKKKRKSRGHNKCRKEVANCLQGDGKKGREPGGGIRFARKCRNCPILSPGCKCRGKGGTCSRGSNALSQKKGVFVRRRGSASGNTLKGLEGTPSNCGEAAGSKHQKERDFGIEGRGGEAGLSETAKNATE